MGAEHKEFYEMQEKIVKAESVLKDTDWIAGELIPYDSENPLTPDWGVRYTKGDFVIYLNRFTVDLITNLINYYENKV